VKQGVYCCARPWHPAGKTKKEDTIAAMSPKLTLLRSVMAGPTAQCTPNHRVVVL